jgi:hypothetical protein
MADTNGLPGGQGALAPGSDNAGVAGRPEASPLYPQHALIVSDVSGVIGLRKRIGRAASSMKLMGLLLAVYFSFTFRTPGSGPPGQASR